MSFPYLVVECDGPNDSYVGTVRGIQQNGDIVVSREMETKEIRPAMFIFNKPKERFLTCPGRNIHPFFQVLPCAYMQHTIGFLLAGQKLMEQRILLTEMRK